MHRFTLFLFFVLGTFLVNGYEEGDRYIYMPDDEGNMILVDLFVEEPAGYKFEAEKSVKFYLYRRGKARQELVYNNNAGLAASMFDPKKPVRFISHGWNSKGSSTINVIINDAFQKSADQNVIVIDWGKGANVLYTTACKNVLLVAKFVAKYIDWLVASGAPINNFHLIGHSLGGHLVGIAGRHVTKGTIPYITALDPANPLWSWKSERVRATDGKYVEVMHTDSGDLGLKEPLGDADFYPNRGDVQPGCTPVPACDHLRAYEYMADSIDHNGFMAIKCTDYKEMYANKCANLGKLHMGGSSPKTGKGIYYLETNKKKPYYQGS